MSHLLTDSASPPHGPSLQLPPTSDTSVTEPAHSDLLDAAASSSSSSSSCPPCSPDPGTEAPGPEPAEVAVGSGVNGEGREGRSEKGCLYCPTCKVTVNSASQLQAHNTGQCFPGPWLGDRGTLPTVTTQAFLGLLIPREGHLEEKSQQPELKIAKDYPAPFSLGQNKRKGL